MQAGRLVSDLDPDVIAHGIVGLVRGAADDWLARPDGTTRAELTARLTDLAWTGLAGLRTPEVTP